MAVIHKAPADSAVLPNFTDYDGTRARFDWSDIPDLCDGMGAGLCNIAYAAVDRHSRGPRANTTALRFVATESTTTALAPREMTYAELGRFTGQFTTLNFSFDTPVTEASGNKYGIDVG